MLLYKVVGKKNPITKETLFYAQAASPYPLDLETVSNLIAQSCTLTRHDIRACLSAFQEQMINALRDGRSVRLDDVGSFRVTIHSKGTALKEDFKVGNIQGLKICFNPSPRLKKSMRIGADGINFQAVGGGTEEPTVPLPGSGGEVIA